MTKISTDCPDSVKRANFPGRGFQALLLALCVVVLMPGILFAANEPTSCSDCHKYGPTDGVRGTSTGAVVGSHAVHGAYTCDTCHVAPGTETSVDFAHRNGDIQMAGSIQGGSYNGGAVIAQTNTPTLNNCANVACHNGSTTPIWGTTGISCTDCHGLPPSTNAHTIHYTAKGWTTGDAANCTQCHPDNTGTHSDRTDGSVVVNAGLNPSGTSPAISCGTAPALGCHNGKATPNWNTSGISCTQCHTSGGADPADPTSGLHDEIPTVSGVMHNPSDPNFSGCEVCHTAIPSDNHWDGIAQTSAPIINFDAVVTGFADGTPPTCASSCHSESASSGPWSRKWHENSDLSDGSECAGCHGVWGSWNGGVKHRSDAQPEATHGTGSYKCKDCHALEAASGYDFTSGTNDWGGTSEHGNGLITINNNGTSFARGTGGNAGKSGCSNACHADGLDGIGAGLHSFETTGWTLETVAGDTVDAGCNSCHGDTGTGQYWPNGSTYPDRAGRHQKHMEQLAARLAITLATANDAQQKQMCDYCHNDPAGAGGGGHNDNVAPADVGAFNHIGDASADGSAYISATQTCAVACHNTKVTEAGKYGWGDAVTSTCTMCHTIGGAGPADPNSGLHNITPTVSAQKHDDVLTACTTCHSSLPVMSATSTHINNSFTANNGSNADRGLFAAYTDGTPGSCLGGASGTAGCHDGAGEAGTWARKWDSAISSANDGTQCQGCHGGFSNDWTFSGAIAGNVDHQRDWDTASSAGDGAEVMANHDGTDKCKVCHVFPDGPYVSTWKTGNHGNDKIDMNSTMGYSSTNFNCTTNCHSEAWGNAGHNLEDSGWAVNNVAGPALDCRGCHGGASPAGGVSVASPHSTDTIFASKGVTYTCEGCHTSHGSGPVSIPENLAVGIDYPTAAHGDAISLGGTDTTGTTEAEICWNCHALNGISEWGVNTDTNAGGANFDFGSLDQPNWVGALWNSAQGLTSGDPFWYKRGTIQSTHAANSANGVSGVDAVGDIRCSYCHDVHDTKVGSPSGAPYLRGTWMGNPYKEDGAPQNGTIYGQHEWGPVPRASVLNNEYGGYQIDQNNGNPTSGWTADSSSGLCSICHGSKTDGTWSLPGDINTLNKFGTASTDWVGTNGHANAVLGGNGTGRANIFRTSDRAPSGVDTNGAKPDMGYANHGSNEGYGFRSIDARGFQHNPMMDASQASSSTRPYGGSFYEWGASVDNTTADLQYHKFSCSKCHNPHASRLPRLMITNCLDTSHNSWDQNAGNGGPSIGNSNNNGITLSSSTAPDSWNRTWSNTTSAQNCHRLAGSDDASPVGFGSGWNTVTPW